MNINLVLLALIFVPILLGLMPIFVKDIKKINITFVIVCTSILAICLFLLFNAHSFEETVVTLSWFSGLGVNFKINGLGILQAVAASIIWVGSSVFSLEYFDHAPQNLRRYYSFFIVTFGATLGIFLANDLFTLFVFFEVMSFASFPLVIHNQDLDSVKAGNSYLTIAVLGGLVMLMGVFLLNGITGTLVIDELYTACLANKDNIAIYFAGAMVFFGFAAKAGMFPLHGWLPKAHPAAPAPASAALSGILIKTGAYGIIIVTLKILSFSYTWFIILLILALATMFIGAVSAFFSTNLKQTLAFSSMSQMGFIITGVAMTGILGEHGSIAAYGSILHMINHTLIKLVLFTCAGIIYQNTHSLDLNKIKGYGKNKLFLKIVFGVAALGIMGIPGFNGYISKTLIHESIVEKIWLFENYSLASSFFQVSEMIFLLSGGFTVAYMTKLFICLFIEQPNESLHENKQYTTLRTKVVLSITALCIFIFGILPHQTMDKLAALGSEFFGVHPLEHAVEYFSFVNLKGAIISVTVGALLYFIIAKLTIATKEKGYINPWKEKYTLENMIFRPMLFTVLPFVFGFVSRIFDVVADVFVIVVNRLFFKSVKIPTTFFEGKPNKPTHHSDISITKSLAYSLLLFGLGFVITMLYLLVAEFRV